jgi:indole-3-glycerol phosphate synthase
MDSISGSPSRVPPGGGAQRASYLDAILPDVRRRLAERKVLVSQAELARTRRAVHRASFTQALRNPGVSVIAEVKRASPSKGAIRPDLDVATLVTAYQAGGAAALSVLTEEDHFRGSLADLQTAAAVTRLPLLRKDFIVDPYQVHEARAFGASAVLLIAAVLDDRDLRNLTALAADLGLDVLLEVHDAGEMARALAVDGAVIGINNRDLRTFEVSLDTSLRLAESVPRGRLLVSESGITDRADLERLAAVGVDAVLVGESLLRAADVVGAVSTLSRPVSAAIRCSGDDKRTEEV